MPYDSPINCSTGMTSNITIEDDIVHSYITSCGDHYVLVKDSDDNNYCGMYKHVFYATCKRLKPEIKSGDTHQQLRKEQSNKSNRKTKSTIYPRICTVYNTITCSILVVVIKT